MKKSVCGIISFLLEGIGNRNNDSTMIKTIRDLLYSMRQNFTPSNVLTKNKQRPVY